MDQNHNYLIHYRMGGEKTGVRRYQYEDGSLTPEGRIHYGIGPARDSADSTIKKAKKAASRVVKSAKKAYKKHEKKVEANRRAKEKRKATEEARAADEKRKADEAAAAEERRQNEEKIAAAKAERDRIRTEIMARPTPQKLLANESLFTNNELETAIKRMELRSNIEKGLPKEHTVKSFLKETGTAALKDVVSETAPNLLRFSASYIAAKATETDFDAKKEFMNYAKSSWHPQDPNKKNKQNNQNKGK